MRQLSSPVEQRDHGRFATDHDMLLSLFDPAAPRATGRWRSLFGLEPARRQWPSRNLSA